MTGLRRASQVFRRTSQDTLSELREVAWTDLKVHQKLGEGAYCEARR